MVCAKFKRPNVVADRTLAYRAPLWAMFVPALFWLVKVVPPDASLITQGAELPAVLSKPELLTGEVKAQTGASTVVLWPSADRTAIKVRGTDVVTVCVTVAVLVMVIGSPGMVIVSVRVVG
jgi:preprotein translocase subunit Sec61beta